MGYAFDMIWPMRPDMDGIMGSQEDVLEFLTNEELLEAAEQAAVELEEFPLDNAILTDEEKSGEEIGPNNAMNEISESIENQVEEC
ncbi:hypothetical protein JTB14_015174 [Gonioctena quinquepunctata]|nr:hypothetical protein JTB14_015174 [Gonioctena quinquepunctata]